MHQNFGKWQYAKPFDRKRRKNNQQVIKYKIVVVLLSLCSRNARDVELHIPFALLK